MYLMLLAEWGVLGASVYLAILVLIGWTLYAARRGPQIAAADSSILSGLGLAFCSLLLMAAGDSLLLADLRPTVVFWVFLGLAMRYVVLLPSPWNESSRKDRTRALTG
jgi:O-antigen ligase